MKLDYLKGKRDDLKKDYKSVEQELRVQLDPTTKNRLEIRLTQICSEIEESEQECKQLEQELEQENTQLALESLRNILQAHESQFSDMQAAFRQTVTKRKYSTSWNWQKPQEIVTELLRAPQGQLKYSALEQFVACLVSRTQDQILRAKLQNWWEQQVNEQQVKNWNELLESVTNYQDQQPQNAHPVLMVLITRSYEPSTREQKGDRYRIKAWLIRDMNQYIDQQQGYSRIELSGAIEEETYLLDDLVKKAPELITGFLTERSDDLVNDPEIHIFLPLKLMNQEVDCWLLTQEFGYQRPLGHVYKVVLRFADRVSRNYLFRGRWEAKWDTHQLSLQRNAFEMFTSDQDNELEELSYVLDDLEDVVGLKLTQAPSQVEPDGLFGVLLQSGLPLAIWGRRSLLESTNEVELDRILKAGCLEELPDTVKEKRREARKQNKGYHIGHDLSLLWDNPKLLPPKPYY